MLGTGESILCGGVKVWKREAVDLNTTRLNARPRGQSTLIQILINATVCMVHLKALSSQLGEAHEKPAHATRRRVLRARQQKKTRAQRRLEIARGLRSAIRTATKSIGLCRRQERAGQYLR